MEVQRGPGFAMRRLVGKVARPRTLLYAGALSLTVIARRDRRRQRVDRLAREQAEQLAAFSARLSQALTHLDLVRAAEHAAREQHGVCATTLWIADPLVPGRWRTWSGTRGSVTVDAAGDRFPIGVAARTGEPVLLTDPLEIARRFPDGSVLLESAGVRAAATFPVFDEHSEPIGALGFGWPGPHVCSNDEVTRLLTITRLCGETARRIDLLAAAQETADGAAQRAAFSSRLASAVTVSATAEVIAAHARVLFGADGAIVTRTDERTDALVVTAAIGLGTDGIVGRRYVTPDEGGPSFESIAARDLVLVPGRDAVAARYPNRPDLLADSGVEAVAAFPLVAGDRPIGAVRLHYGADGLRPDVLSDRSVRFAHEAAQALERAHLADRQRQALTRANRLRDAVAALASTTNEAEVEAAVLTKGLPALVCTAGTLVVCDEDAPGKVRAPARDGGAVPNVAVPATRSTLLGAAVLDRAPVYLRDRREASLPLLATDEGDARAVGSAAVLPLTVRSECIGALVLEWREAVGFSDAERYALESYAGYAGQALARARISAREHEIATALQQELLPQQVPAAPGTQVATRYRPAMRGLDIGGDWYDVIPLTSTRTAFVVGDVVGKGPSAAAQMGQLRTAVRATALDGAPDGMLSALDQIVEYHLGPDCMATVSLCVFDALDRSITYASAGHCPGLLVDDTGRSEWLPANGPPVGTGWSRPREAVQIEVARSSRLVLFTDGLVEQRGESIDEGLERLRAMVAHTRHLGVEKCADTVLAALAPASARADDIALLVVDLEPAPPPLDLRVLAEATAVARVRHDLQEWLVRSFVDTEAIADLLIAANEAVTNAVEHGSRGPSAEVRLRATRVEGQVQIEVKDDGSTTIAHDDPDRGRGLMIMRELMDGVEVVPSLVGTTVRMERTLH